VLPSILAPAATRHGSPASNWSIAEAGNSIPIPTSTDGHVARWRGCPFARVGRPVHADLVPLLFESTMPGHAGGRAV
jgi:hypothetical protein